MSKGDTGEAEFQGREVLYMSRDDTLLFIDNIQALE